MSDTSKSGRLLFPALAVLFAGLTLLAYREALLLPFFFDDLGIIPWMESKSLLELAGKPGGMSYYRPLTHVLWKLVALCSGGYHPFVHHAINLGTHFINGFLVAWLAVDLWPDGNRAFRGLAAGALFILFPFSYQAVPWVAALNHTLVTTLALGSIAAYRQACKNRAQKRRWWALALVLATLAPFCHESGLMLAPLALALELAFSPGRPLWSRVRRALWLFVPALAYLLLWSLVPRDGGALKAPHLETLFQNGVYFLQGLAFPLESLGRFGPLRQVDGLWSALLLGCVAAAGLLLLQRRWGDRRSAFPWLWVGLSVLPAWLMLPFDYVINGPRLLYLASAGVAWLWADGVVLITRPIRSFRWKQAAALTLLTVAIWPGFMFIRERMDLHRMGGEMIDQVTEQALLGAGDGEGATVFVNLPSWLARKENFYPLGHEGVQFWPGYVSARELVFANSQQWVEVEAVEFGNIVQEMPYWYGVSGQVVDWDGFSQRFWSSRMVYLADMQPNRIVVRPAGELLPDVEPAGLVASFGDQVYLESARAWRQDDGVLVEYIWRYEGTTTDLNIFVHGLDAEGNLIAQADGPAVGRMLPFWQWPAGRRVRDLRWLPGEGLAQVQTGLYDSCGERLSATDPFGERFPADAVPLLIEE